MAHWLDGLFDSGAVTIEWDGTEMPEAAILAFGEQFEVANDGERNLVTIRFAGMDGDVTGDTDENFVTTITGDEDTNVVVMRALSLAWDEEASEGEAEIKISEEELAGGALEIWHNAKRVYQAASSGAVVGNTTGINDLVGGLRLTHRTINTTNVALDTTTKDSSVFVIASADRNVTLPAPSEARTFILYIIGSSTVTVKRHASEKINDVAGNYVVPAGDSIVIIGSDGTDYVAHTIVDGGGGGSEEAAIVFSPVDTLRENNTDTPADANTDQTSATSFFIRSGPACDITGIRFYWAGTANQVVKTVLYSAAGAVLKTANVTTAGAGVYTSTFSSPHTASPGIQYKSAVYDTTGSGQKYTKVANNSATAGLVPARPFFGGRRIGWINLGLWLAGDNNPTSTAANEWYLVEPVLSE